MNWWRKTFFAGCALALVLACYSFSPVLADDPVQNESAQHDANNPPPDPSTRQPMPPETQTQQAVRAMKEKTVAKVAEINNLREQNRISEKEWRAAILAIRDEVDAFNRSVGLPVAPSTTNVLNLESLASATATLDWLQQMRYVDQTEDCRNGCGVASSKAVLDYEHAAYGTPAYSFNYIAQNLQLACCSEPGSDCPGVYLASCAPSIEHTLETLGTPFSWVAVQPGDQSWWFTRLQTSISGFRYPQVLFTQPNWDDLGGVYLPGWETADDGSKHYIVVSGYNSTDQTVWYQDSAWWAGALGDKWWYASHVWSVNANADTSSDCAHPNKLIY